MRSRPTVALMYEKKENECNAAIFAIIHVILTTSAERSRGKVRILKIFVADVADGCLNVENRVWIEHVEHLLSFAAGDYEFAIDKRFHVVRERWLRYAERFEQFGCCQFSIGV